MSFWDSVKKVGKEIGTTIYDDTYKKLHRILEYEEKYGEYPDEELWRLYRSASGNRRLAIARVLKKRQLERDQ